LARVLSTRRNAAGVTSSRLRHTVGRDATAPSSLLARGVDVGDRLTARGQHRRDIHPDLPAVMNGEEVAPPTARRFSPTRSANRRSSHRRDIKGIALICRKF
jgi:hypothetical protein